MTEQWIRWEPIKDLVPNYLVITAEQHATTLYILLAPDNDDRRGNYVLITFDNSVQAYSNIEEGVLLKYWAPHVWPDGSTFEGDWSFYKVTNSSYMKTLTYHEPSWQHYLFLTDTSIVSVIADKDPIVQQLHHYDLLRMV